MDSFVAQALVFFGVSIILVPLFQKLGFGSVLGYLIAGIVVGPFGFKFINEAESIMHFSELGVTLLLFIIGLEIQPRKLWAMRRHLFGLGGMQVTLATLVFFLIGQSMGLSPIAGAVLGFGLSLSSTAFAVQTLNEKHQFNTEFGRSSFSILLMQDLCAIPALAIIPAFAVQTQGSSFSLQNAGAALAVIVFLILSSRFLIRPAFRLIASTRTRELFTGTALFIVLGVAALMQKVGLSAALGTFIAGMLLADSEYRHELETNIDPFKSLLMGLFFIAVGMSVNLNLIIQSPVKVIAWAALYMFIKFLVIYVAGRVFKLNHTNAKLMAIYIAQGGEFAFVIFGMATQFQFVQKDIVDLLIAMITVSMALSPVVTIINEKISEFRQKNSNPQYDEIKDESPEVIIAGFGRFGQIFARIMRAQQIPFVAIDHDPDQIELVRRFGNKVYYGDASRLDLLEAAGAAKAKYFILAIDDVEASIQTAKTIQERFKNLKLYVRVRNRGHAFDMMDLGITNFKRELFDSSVYFVSDLLKDMGYSEKAADTIVEKFKRHDELMLLEQYKVRNDDKAFVSVSAQGVAQLAQVLSNESTKTYVDASK